MKYLLFIFILTHCSQINRLEVGHCYSDDVSESIKVVEKLKFGMNVVSIGLFSVFVEERYLRNDRQQHFTEIDCSFFDKMVSNRKK